jgi:hypothetical protein
MFVYNWLLGIGLTYLSTSSAIISASSAANSTPVGPPPQTTNDKRRLRSSGVVVGREASSRLAERVSLNDHAEVNEISPYS